MGNKIKASEIAGYLGLPLIGEDIEIDGVCPSDMVENGKLIFLSKNNYLEKFNTRALYLVRENKEIDRQSLNSYIKVLNPRLAFAKIIDRFFLKKEEPEISPTAKIGKNVDLGERVSIRENCVIGDNVKIGKGTIIRHNVVVAKNTIIGENCYLKSGSVIGEDGFGFDFEEDGIPVRLPHLGKVVVGDNVEIGANCTIARGTLSDTIINRNVKVDDQVHIAHNCVIGENTIITAQAEISGSVKIGKNCWLGPNCSIIQKIKIGDRVVVGIGAIVTEDIPDNKTIMGLEALNLRTLLKLKKRLGYHG